MMVYRIAAPKRADDLSGTGAKLYGGRWNSPGRPVLYTAQNISLAMLEKLVHTPRSNLKLPFTVACIKVPENLACTSIGPSQLQADWRGFPFRAGTVALGDQWLEDGNAPMLKVPSAINPYECNFLLNPLHPGCKDLKITEARALSFDLRFEEWV